MKLIGYTLPRPFAGYSIPISVQSVYLRSFCQARGFDYALPVTEFYTPKNYSALSGILGQNVEGMVCISVFIFEELLSCPSVLERFLGRSDITIWCPLENESGDPRYILERIIEFKKLNRLSNRQSRGASG